MAKESDDRSISSNNIARGFKAKNDFPWPLIKSEKIFDLKYGKSLVETSRNIGKIPVYGSNGRCGWHDKPLQNGPGVILGRKGQGPLGVEWCSSEFWVIDTAYYLILLTDEVDLKYTYYLIKFVGLNHLKDGTSNPSLSRETFKSQYFPIPSIEEQRSIVRIIGTIDDKIELNRQMNETLEAMARAIFKSWFVDFDPVRAKAEGRDTGLPPEIAVLFPDGFEEIDGREVPKGWGVGAVQDLCLSIENGGTPKRMESTYWNEGTIPWFKTGELSDDPLIESDEKITELGLTESACRLWQPKTILIALYASPTVGRLGILEILGTANQACSALVAKIDFGFLFLYYSLLFSRDQLQNIAVGAAQQNINQQVLKEHRILIPDVSIAQQFQQIIEKLYEKKLNNIQQSRTLAQTRDALLPKLMSGEIRVNLIVI
jgi:type I restriction enzyme, S subunit